MGKFRKILRLSDPYPNLWYEFFCYLKAVLAVSFLVLGIFFLFYPFFLEVGIGPFVTSVTPFGKDIFALFSEVFSDVSGWNIILGAILVFLGIYLFSRIKLVWDLYRLLKNQAPSSSLRYKSRTR